MKKITALLMTLPLSLAACTHGTPSPGTHTGSGSTTSENMSIGSVRPPFDEVLQKAEAGDADYQFELAAMYHDGDGVERDYGKAIEWYTKSAKAGKRMAAFNVALMYKNGEGTSVDLDVARGWFIRASDAGDVRAAHQLGIMTYTGEGMKQDFSKALKYFTKAALGGLAEAQMNTGVMYLRAESVPQDVVEGYAWLELAKEGASERAAGLLDQLIPKLNAEQIKKGDARAAELEKEIKKLDAMTR